MNISAQDFFKMTDVSPDCVLTGAELQAVFWKYRELQQGFERQQVFWKTSNGAIADAYRKLATVQEALQNSQELLREANERLEGKVIERTAALDEARELAESVFASISDALLIVDSQGSIRKANRSALALLGYEEKELIGRSISTLLQLEQNCERPLASNWREALLEDQPVQGREVSYRTKRDDVVPILFSAAKIKNARDELLGIVCVATDVSERRQREAELYAQFQRIRQQQETIRTLSLPIIQIWPQVLALPIVGELDRERAAETIQHLLEAVSESRSSFVIIDVTGVKTMDAVATEQLLRMERATRLLGATCLISGMSPAVAASVVQQGSDIHDLKSFRTLEAALRHAFRRLAEPAERPKGAGQQR